MYPHLFTVNVSLSTGYASEEHNKNFNYMHVPYVVDEHAHHNANVSTTNTRHT